MIRIGSNWRFGLSGRSHPASSGVASTAAAISRRRRNAAQICPPVVCKPMENITTMMPAWSNTTPAVLMLDSISHPLPDPEGRPIESSADYGTGGMTCHKSER